MKDDIALVAAALSGDPEMFSPIVERYQDAVFAIALARLRNFADAEDVAQEVFVEAFENLGKLSNPSSLGAWLRSIAIHQCIDHLRQARESIGLDEIAEQVEAAANPQIEVEQQELCDQVMAAIWQLSKKQRETTTLFYVNGYSQQEIARIQEVPIGTIRRRLHDAREKLKEEMIGLVEDVLKFGAPKGDFGKRVFEILSRYRLDATPWDELGEIASTLREIGAAGLDGFVKALESPYYQTRRFAVRVLPDSGLSQEVIEQLLKKALNDANKEVRKLAFLELADIIYEDESRREEIVPYMIPLLTDPSWRIRSYVASVLYGQDYFEGYVRYVPLDCVVRAFLAEKNQIVKQNLIKLMCAVLDAQESDESKRR